MCCIFTCCGWVIDLVQRLWVFFMSFCISTAVCCVLITSSMSGIALGYNYSLAEFVDLKETNVSVYLKRGIFDDEIVDEADWRRRGGGPIKGHVRDTDLMTGAPEDEIEDMPERSGRRLDDSILQSDDAHKFEGSLMKLTVKAPYQTTEYTTVTSDQRMAEFVSKYPDGSPEQLKAIQGLINMRKAAAQRDPNNRLASTYNYDRSILNAPGEGSKDVGYRRKFGFGPDEIPINPQSRNKIILDMARKAVPPETIGQKGNWLHPKLSSIDPNIDFGGTDFYYPERKTYPKPIAMHLGPFPPTPSMMGRTTKAPKAVAVISKSVEQIRNRDKQTDVGMDRFKENMIVDKYEIPRPHPAEQIKTEHGGWKKSEVDYYDEDIKGLPVRKKRNINTIKAKLVTEPREVNSKGENVKIKEISSKANKITSFTNDFLNKLLSSNKPLSNELNLYNESKESTKIQNSKTNDNFHESTKRVATMIGSMFSLF